MELKGTARLDQGMAIGELTRDLVSIPSHEDEATAGDFIEAWLQSETDATVTRDDVGNVIARRGTGTGLALVGHHDVVPPDDAQLDGGDYVVYEEDGRLFGRGTADMKGAVAAMLCAFRDADPVGELIVASFVGEETGGDGARHAIDTGFAPAYAIVGEGSTNYSGAGVTDVVIAHKGRRGSSIVAGGTSAHASEPDAGENAVYRACDAIDLVRDLDSPSTEVLGHQMEGSIAVTGIEGGAAWNVIPDRCEVTLDERTVPGARASLERLDHLPGITWTVDQDLPPMRCDDEGFAESVRSAARDAGGQAEFVTKPHATDAGWLATAGVSCVICGPAERGQAHTATESVSLDVLERCYRIYRTAAETVA